MDSVTVGARERRTVYGTRVFAAEGACRSSDEKEENAMIKFLLWVIALPFRLVGVAVTP
jgi:hypothetical protein